MYNYLEVRGINMFSKELSAAAARPLVLSTLSRGESYGYEIIQHLKELSGGRVEWAEGALYPLLKRMEQEGLVQSTWRESDSGRSRKYYRLTAQGAESLSAERRQWTLANDMLTRLWSPRLTFA